MKKYAFLIFLFLNCSYFAFSQTAVQHISAPELESILSDSITLVDVRTDVEYDQWYLPGALNINLFDKHFNEKFDVFDKETPIYLYCRSGHRSVMAGNKLISMGFKNVYSLDGGTQVWRKSKLPVKYW